MKKIKHQGAWQVKDWCFKHENTGILRTHKTLSFSKKWKPSLSSFIKNMLVCMLLSVPQFVPHQSYCNSVAHWHCTRHYPCTAYKECRHWWILIMKVMMIMIKMIKMIIIVMTTDYKIVIIILSGMRQVERTIFIFLFVCFLMFSSLLLFYTTLHIIIQCTLKP